MIVIQLAIGNINRDLTFVFSAIFCFLGAVITTTTLFISKLLAIYYPKYLEETPTSSTPYRHSHSSSGGPEHVSLGDMSRKKEDDTVVDLRATVAELEAHKTELKKTQEELKKTVRQQKKRIKELERQVADKEGGGKEGKRDGGDSA